VYDTPPGVSSPALSAARNCDFVLICQHDGVHRPPKAALITSAMSVPWFGVASITRSSTAA
jgi:hypothetical protein